MTDRAAAPTERATACPFVAFEDERDERSDRPDHRHRCYAESKPAPRAIAHQEAFCLSPQFAACPTFQDWARREAAHSATSRSAAAVSAAAASEAIDDDDEEPGTDPAEFDAEDEGDYGRPATTEPSRSGSRDWAAPPPWVVETPPPASAAGGSGGAKSGGSKKGGAAKAGAAAAGAGAGLAASRWLSDEPFDEDAAAPGSASSAPAGKASIASAATPAPSAAVYDPGTADAPQTATPNPELAGLAAAGASRSRTRSSSRPPSGQAKAGRRPPVNDDRGPSWERPRRFEAYPSLRTRVGLPAVPRVLLALVGLGLAAVILFMVPSLFFSKGDQGTGDASPTPSAVPSASVSTTPVPAATPLTYTVKAGDNLGKIARKFGVTQKDILAANPKIKDPNRIAVGQVIVIPAAAAPTEVIDSGPTSPSPRPSSAAP
jgi:LysM repeat protein